ncbi:quinoprotein relay system zinc metallohydrolase 2 [Methylobacillus arboreus]|uniref:quinoprotein relay system zinc metallohydrolase 2 n=1 Tax=Methylobacillus arboreus TaxID=755170 RepID=UPI001E5ECBD7|nr:quinoprotein relay system zinc metallohydrolase 2 [Methylobacillus arboreus]MCB5190506.1 quinoprotein relay system zinc metallohydrolase 2 [Methylobacillus arboreus]
MSRTIPLFFLASLFWLLPAYSLAQELGIREVAPGVYMHQGAHEDLDDGYQGDISNIGFIIGTEGVAVIDTGGSQQVGQALLASIRKLTNLPVLYVINTHIHPDHIFGNAAFKQEQAIFIGHAKLANAMELRKDAYLRQGHDLLGEQFSGSEVIKPTLMVESSQELDIGERKLLLTAYPNAHTNTDLTVLDEKTGTLWTGDLLFIERTPSIDGDIKGWLSAIAQLQQLKGIRHAIPGHGPATQDLQGALNNQARYLNLLLSDVRNAIKQGKTMEQAMDSAAASEASHWQLFNSVNRRNVNLIYPALEWE